jgi:transcriptional regulator with XRE-family HTH domain
MDTIVATHPPMPTAPQEAPMLRRGRRRRGAPPHAAQNAFGAFIAARREEIGMTQETLGKLVTDARASIANIERGGRLPYEDHDRLRILAAALQVDEEALILLAEENREDYTFPGAGPGITNAHRDLALLLETGWGRFLDLPLVKAKAIVDKSVLVEPAKGSEPSAFGAWLLAKRLEQSVSQSDLGKAIGGARSYVSMVENGTKGASWPDRKILAVATLLKADADEVRALVARSRQFYRVETKLGQVDEVSVAHRQLAAGLVAKWHMLPAKALVKVEKTLADGLAP